MRCIIRIILPVLLLASFVLPASAQLYPGDFVAFSGGVIYGVFAQNGKVMTLANMMNTFGPLVLAIRPAPKNAGVYALVDRDRYQNNSSSVLLSVTPAGVAKTILWLGSWTPNGLAVDVDGSILFSNIAAPYVSNLLRARGSTVSTLGQVPVIARHIRIDADTGDYLVSGLESAIHGHILRVDRKTYRVTTIRTYTGYAPPSIIDYDQKTGHIWHVGTLIHRDSGVPLRAIKAAGPWALFVEQDTSNILFAHQGAIQRRAPDGAVLRTWSTPSLTFFGLCKLGERKLSGEGSIRPGNVFKVHLRFPQSPWASYCAALSFSGLRPGLAAFHKTLHINPDPLFWLTACRDVPGFTSGFAGRLDAAGAGTLTIRLPSGLTQRLGITVAAVAFNRALPAGIDCGASITVPMWPGM